MKRRSRRGSWIPNDGMTDDTLARCPFAEGMDQDRPLLRAPRDLHRGHRADRGVGEDGSRQIKPAPAGSGG